MKRMKSKKGFIFTIVTIFLLLSVFFLAHQYLNRNKASQEDMAEAIYAARSNFIRENLVTDFFSMLDVEFDEIRRTDDSIILRFHRMNNVSIDNVYDDRLEMLESFYENNVSQMSNFEIHIEEFDPSFIFSPYESEFVVDTKKNKNHFYLYTNDYGNLNHIKATIKLNITKDKVDEITYVGNSTFDDPMIVTTVYDANDVLIKNLTQHLDPEVENAPLRIATNKSVNKYIHPATNIPSKQYVQIHFGSVRHKNIQGPDKLIDGTYFIEAVGLDVQIRDFELNYTKLDDKAVLEMTGMMEVR